MEKRTNEPSVPFSIDLDAVFSKHVSWKNLTVNEQISHGPLSFPQNNVHEHPRTGGFSNQIAPSTGAVEHLFF